MVATASAFFKCRCVLRELRLLFDDAVAQTWSGVNVIQTPELTRATALSKRIHQFYAQHWRLLQQAPVLHTAMAFVFSNAV